MADNQKIFDGILDNALNVFRLAAGERAASFEGLERLKKRLIAKLLSQELNAIQRLKLGKFFQQTDAIIAAEYRQLELNLDLPEISATVSELTVQSLEVGIGAKALKIPTTDYFKSVASDVLIQGAPSKFWWQRQAADLSFAFSTQVRQGLINGETNQDIISRIIGKNGAPGIMDVARRNAAALVQTSVQAVANDARRATFDANDDVIKGLKQISTLDGRTSLICISYSGKEWNLKREPINGNTMPFNGGCPRHFNCRSLEIPITKTFRELGVDIDERKPSTRASSEGQIEADTDFATFLVRKGKPYQDKMLGEGRADLWRAGKITLRDLVDGNGRPLALAELKRNFGVRKANPAKNGFFGEAYMASLPAKTKQPFDNWEALVENGTVGLKQFEKAMGNVSKRLGLRSDIKPDDLLGELVDNKEGFLFVAPLKGYARALEKVTDDYKGDWSQVNDIVRGTVSVKTLDDVTAAINAMRAEGIDFVAKPKDRFIKPSMGYRDILGLVRLPNGMNAEIQFHVKSMTAAKNKAHKFYEKSRTIAGKYPDVEPTIPPWIKADLDEYDRLYKKQLDIYNKAWADTPKG